MFMHWSWEPWEVEAGESAAACVKHDTDADAYMSCWSWTMDEEGVWESDIKSYLLDPSTVTEDSKLEDLDSVPVILPTMFGSWLCAAPMEFDMRMMTSCVRLLPREDSQADPSYQGGESVTVVTYLTSRMTGRITEAQAINDNPGMLGEENRGFVAF